MKPAITILEQIKLLKSQNLIFEDEAKAEYFLRHNSYHRLSEYWQKYKTKSGECENSFRNCY